MCVCTVEENEPCTEVQVHRLVEDIEEGIISTDETVDRDQGMHACKLQPTCTLFYKQRKRMK